MGLTSRMQHPRAPRLTPAALEAAATAFLAQAEGVKCSTVSNRGWRSVIKQGPSADALVFLGTDQETLVDNEKDLGIVAGGVFRTADDRPAPGNPARSLDRYQWNAIRVLAPHDLPNHDVLTLSASLGFGGRGSAKRIGRVVGLSDRMVRKIQDRHAAWAAENLDPAALVAALDAGLPRDDMVVPRRTPSRRGRKARLAVRPVLTLVPNIPEPARPRQPYRPRARPPRWVDPLQTDMFQDQEAA